MKSLVNNAKTKLSVMVFVILGLCIGGCSDSEPFSWSVEQAKSRKTLVCELTIEPPELTFDDKRIVFGPAWLERRPDGDYALCFRLEKGNDIFRTSPSPFFVLDDLRSSFSERHGRDWIQFVERIDDPDISKSSASLIQKWSDVRLKNIRFIRKPE